MLSLQYYAVCTRLCMRQTGKEREEGEIDKERRAAAVSLPYFLARWRLRARREFSFRRAARPASASEEANMGMRQHGRREGGRRAGKTAQIDSVETKNQTYAFFPDRRRQNRVSDSAAHLNKSFPEGNFLVPKLCCFKNIVPFYKIWPIGRAGRHQKWAE